MTFWEHIDELRSRMISCLVSLILVTIVAYFFSDKIFNFINQPIYDLKNSNFKQIFSTLTGPFLIYLSISFFTGVFFSFPIILHYIFWSHYDHYWTVIFVYSTKNKCSNIILLEHRLRWHRRGRKFNSCRAHQISKAEEKFELIRSFLLICLQFIFIII